MDVAQGAPERRPNRLIHDKSPYLLQHAYNPVDWHAWGPEAMEMARVQDKPIFLSIGYATCHWCHVMAHESFEDEDVARLLNQSFVSIKVDREERPDVDHVYMTVCQALTGRGGWPLSIFMTPEGKPFFSGTYFPKTRRMGMSGFTDLLVHIAHLWRTDRQRLLNAAEQITQAIQPRADHPSGDGALDEGILRRGFEQLARSFDTRWGGFGQAPKFPTPHQLTFLLRWHHRTGDAFALEMVEKTLEAMRRGGIFDHVGFGFHRYSVDERWLVPHFEKMLYDQALLAMAYTEAFQATGKAFHGRVAREILAYVLRDMRSEDGAFFSAEDADSEGREGRFYVWRPGQVREVLGEGLGELYCRLHDVAEPGNFEEGWSIPHTPMEYGGMAHLSGLGEDELANRLEDARGRLFAAREARIRPLKDDKVLTAWNGLMIAALSKAAQALGEPSYAAAARRAAEFLLSRLSASNGRLLRRHRQGEAAHAGFLEDYAFLVWGLIELYEADLDVRWLEEALRINSAMLELFWDEERGGLFFMGTQNEALIARSKEAYDGALPSGNSVAALNLLRLGRMTGRPDLETKAEQLVRAFIESVRQAPMAHTQFLQAVDFMLGPVQEIVVAGDAREPGARALVAAVHRRFLPRRVLLFRGSGAQGERLAALAPFVRPLEPLHGRATAFVCQGQACDRPVADPAELEGVLSGPRGAATGHVLDTTSPHPV